MVQLSGYSMMKYSAIFVLCLGLIFFGVGYYMSNSTRNFLAFAKPVELTVIAIDKKLTSSGGSNSGMTSVKSLYRAVFSTVNSSGETVTFESNSWTGSRPHNEGDVVPGLYNEDTGKMVSHSILEGEQFMASLFAYIGGGTAIFGFIALIWARRWKPAR
jgi:hypothetical protein